MMMGGGRGGDTNDADIDVDGHDIGKVMMTTSYDDDGDPFLSFFLCRRICHKPRLIPASGPVVSATGTAATPRQSPTT